MGYNELCDRLSKTMVHIHIIDIVEVIGKSQITDIKSINCCISSILASSEKQIASHACCQLQK